MLRNNKGLAEVVALKVLLVLVSTGLVVTSMNGTMKKQVEKIKAAHNAPITVDKDLTGNRGYIN